MFDNLALWPTYQKLYAESANKSLVITWVFFDMPGTNQATIALMSWKSYYLHIN